jgi:hypothetical protein
MNRDSATRDHASETTHGICAAAELDQKYPIAGPPKDKRRVAIDDVARNTEPSRLRDDVVKGAKGAAKYVGPVGLRSRVDIVERDLLLAGILPCHSLFAR